LNLIHVIVQILGVGFDPGFVFLHDIYSHHMVDSGRLVTRSKRLISHQHVWQLWVKD